MADTGRSIEVALERERKYELPPRVRLRLSELGSLSPTRRLRLSADYLDTPELDLFRRGITLRRRRGGDDDGWHLKTPADGGHRVEHRMPGAACERVPAALREVVAEAVGERPILPLLRLRTTRTATELFDDTGRARAEISVDEVRATLLLPPGGRSHWIEAELELPSDEPAATLDLLDAELRRQGLTPARHSSKAGRVLGAVRPADADRSAVGTARAAVCRELGRLQHLEPAVLRDEPESVHDARVALRRLRSLLGAYGRLLGSADDVRALRAELRWAGLRLSAARDLEVMGELLAGVLGQLPEESRNRASALWEQALAARTEEARGDCATALATRRWDALHARITALILARPGHVDETAGLDALRRLAAVPLGRAARRYARALRTPSIGAWHEVRKAAKAARYALEAIAHHPDATAADRAAHETWKAIAGSLGEVQDVAVVRAALPGFASETSDADVIADVDAHLAARAAADLAEADHLLSGAVRALRDFRPGR
ncbi:CHAD domain-containing protein [Tessaracoccus lapidicaptus]|uniref:CYTH and CHAD domain-containing protein n=1 Tax=Tessaracoccus lapidicaptus TaxID=1427523 RepID=UPI00333FE02B